MPLINLIYETLLSQGHEVIGIFPVHDALCPEFVADVFESVLAVIYLELGYNVVRKYILDIMVPYIESNTVFYTF